MGDSQPPPTDDPAISLESLGPDAVFSRSGQFGDGAVRKRRQETSSQRSISQTGYVHGQHYASHYQQLQTRTEPFNLSPLAATLPDPSYQNYGHLPQRYPSTPSSAGIVYQTQNNPQYGVPHNMTPANAQYPYPAQYQGVYVAGNSPQSAPIGNQFYPQGFMGQQQPHASPYMIQQTQYAPHGLVYPGVQQPAQYGPRSSLSEDSRNPLPRRTNEVMGISSSNGEYRCSQSPSKY
jgi:hypothetical protein